MKKSMKSRNFAVAAAMVAAAASASAVEGTQYFRYEVLATRSRAEVPAELATARVTERPDERGNTHGSYGPQGIDSTQTRAEVIADLLLWRESGMAELSNDMTGQQVFSDRYPQAQARYFALRASPRYAQLVQKIVDQRGQAATAASATARAR